MLDGGTIGSAASPATLNSNTYETLWKLLWDSMADAQAAVGGGRGASAQADWDADRTITLPDARGREVIGTGTGAGLTARTHGDAGAAEDHQLTEAELAAHTHFTGPIYHFNDPSSDGNIGSGSQGRVAATVESGSTGGDTAHNNMQPWLALNFIIKI